MTKSLYTIESTHGNTALETHGFDTLRAAVDTLNGWFGTDISTADIDSELGRGPYVQEDSSLSCTLSKYESPRQSTQGTPNDHLKSQSGRAAHNRDNRRK